MHNLSGEASAGFGNPYGLFPRKVKLQCLRPKDEQITIPGLQGPACLILLYSC